MVVYISKGISNPYMDKNGVIWVKSGADKRKATSREEIQRMYQNAGLIHGDEIPVDGMTINNIDEKLFSEFYQKQYEESLEEQELSLKQIFDNLNLSKNGRVNIAGSLLFGNNNKHLLPAFIVKCVTYPGDFISAPVRIFIFSNRIEIISPGNLPNNLTIENIKNGNSNIRNPILASFATRILPYRGLGTGIRRALKAYKNIKFVEDRSGNNFKIIIH